MDDTTMLNLKIYRKRRQIADIVSALFVLLFIYAALNKLLDFQKFQVQIGRSPLLAPFPVLISWLVPGLEVLICFLLMSKRWQEFGLYSAFTLMVMFTGYIVCILNFSNDIPCSCGGVLEKMTWKQHCWFNIVFVVLGVAGALVYPEQKKEIIAQ